jgi:curved DNA-binding protein CbpA
MIGLPISPAPTTVTVGSVVASLALQLATGRHRSFWEHRALDPYAVLQVRPDAEETVIAAAYRALARRFHPDVAGERHASTMAVINGAWEILRDPARRRAHDLTWSARTAAFAGHDAVGHGAAVGQGPAGTGAAGPPPGRPVGSVLDFGRHVGWSIGEIARVDPGYLDWLDGRPEGRPYRDEIDATLRRTGWRRDPSPRPVARRGWFAR